MPGFITKGYIGEKACFPHPGGAFYLNQYFFAEQEVQAVFDNGLHIYRDPGGEVEFSFPGDMHQRVQLVLAQVAVVDIDVAIHFFQVHPKTIGVVVYQVHGQEGLVEPHIFDLDIFDGTVIEALRFLAGEQEKGQ